ncbi:MAG: hypothetical protein HN348_35805, partial [Proteobacteria bacterium]|nr:hypothetical protein [Pseudomonadota bacterium]
GPSVALPGGTSGASDMGTALAVATTILNLVAGNLGTTVELSGYTGKISKFKEIEELVDEMNAGKIGALLIDDVNPVYALPAKTGFDLALNKVDFSVSLSSHPDETAAVVDLVLPTADVFEDWGDEEPSAGYWLLRQPAALPMYGAPSIGDLLLRLRSTEASSQTWHEYLMNRWKREIYPQTRLQEISFKSVESPSTTPEESEPSPADEEGGFLTWWHDCLAKGYFKSPLGAQRFQGVVVAASVDSLAQPSAASFAHKGDFYLLGFPHHFVSDGRFANAPWAWEVPDPMTGLVWDTWVLLHPDAAADLGVGDNDLVSIKSKRGTLKLPVKVYPHIHREAVAVPFGGGHIANGRYSSFTGQRLIDLL